MHQYIAFYKPCNVLSQFSVEGDKKTLADFFRNIPKNIYPVGRLDYDSEGLLLLTNDTALTHQLLTPAFGHQRTYWVQVDGAITVDAIKKLEQGVVITIDGKPHHTLPAISEAMAAPDNIADRNPPVRYRKAIPTSWLSLKLTEGKNRQVRKMTAAVGYPTLRLIRYAIGKLTIGTMQPGEFHTYDEKIKELVLGR